MNKFLIFISAVLIVSGCKTAQAVRESRATEALPAKEIAARHVANAKDYKTLYIKSSARFQDDKQTQNVTAEIRILKDEKILVSVRFLGITMAKALITPDKVRYYEKINSEYFEGDYTTLSRWLGTDLDFTRVQNMLTGLAMDDLSRGGFESTIEDKLYKLTQTQNGTTKAFFFEAGRFLIKRQQIDQPAQDRSLLVTYPAHTPHQKAVLPASIQIEANQKKGKTTIGIAYDSVTFDEDLTFPYSVPEGYERIFID